MRLWTVIAISLLLGAPIRAQEGVSFERIQLRVSSTGAGATVVVDRGTRDNVAIGDLVLLHPRGGGTYRGSVIQLDDRSAVVELRDKSFVPVPGTRGEVLIPESRLPAPGVEEQVETPPGTEDHPPWPNQDRPWTEGMPLLAQVQPVRPEERRSQVTGRFYTIGNITQTSLDDFNNSFARVGTDFLYENPFGEGGALRFNGEFNYKTDLDDDASLDFLLQRLSYVQGGTRFSDTRWEVGRYLQNGIPEFGFLDGFEWGYRTPGGNRLGASIGFMPEPTEDFDTGSDFQVAAYYLWAADPNEELTIGGGYQKSFHHGDPDRDLFIAKFNYLPLESWYLNGTAWIDLYTSSDRVKGSGFDLTQAVASLGRRWDDGSGIDLSYLHQEFPEIDRDEFIPILANDLADNRYDRLTLNAWGWLNDDQRLHGQVGGWDDEEETGGFAELGLDTQNVFLDRDRLDITAFGTSARYNSGGGARLSYGRFTESGRWDLFYEIAQYHQHDFPNDRDDLLQHRLRLSRSFFTDNGWSLSFDAEATLWDSEWSWGAGFYMQKSF